MSNPKKSKRDVALYNLVTEYESSSSRGKNVYLDHRAYVQLIDFYEDEGQLDRALVVADLAASHHSFSSEFYLRKAQLLLQLNDEQQALTVLEKANTFAPNDLEISLLRAEALTYLHRYAEALEELAYYKTEANPESLSDVFLLESLVFEHQGDSHRMFEALQASIQLDPHNEEALERLLVCTTYCENYAESRELHEWVIDQEPYNAQAWYNLGHILAYLRFYDEAIEAFEYAFIIQEDFEEAYLEYADLCFELKRYAKALEAYLQVSEARSGDCDLLLQIGRCYQFEGQLSEARRHFHRALRVDPGSDEAYFQLGECYIAEEKWEKALHSLLRATEIDPSQEDYVLALAEVYLHVDDPHKAEQYYLKAIRMAPHEGRAWMSYAWFLVWQERNHEVIDLITQAEEQSGGPDLAFTSVALLMVLNYRKEAFVRLGEALEDYFDDREMLFEYLPDLRYDPKVQALINLYHPL